MPRQPQKARMEEERGQKIGGGSIDRGVRSKRRGPQSGVEPHVAPSSRATFGSSVGQPNASPAGPRGSGAGGAGSSGNRRISDGPLLQWIP